MKHQFEKRAFCWFTLHRNYITVRGTKSKVVGAYLLSVITEHLSEISNDQLVYRT
jgi:hypothetical protein